MFLFRRLCWFPSDVINHGRLGHGFFRDLEVRRWSTFQGRPCYEPSLWTLPAQDYIHWFWWLYDYLYRPLLGLQENTPTNDLQIMGFPYLCGFVWNGVTPISMVYHPLSAWTCYKWGCYQSIFIGTTYINPFFVGIFFLSWGIFYKDFYIFPNIPFPMGIFIGNPLPFPWDQVLDGVEV